MYEAGLEAGSWVDRLDAVLSTYATHALALPRLSWALVYEPVDPRLDIDRLESRRRYREGMADLIRRGMEAGELPEQDPGLTAAAVVGAMAESLLRPTSPSGGRVGPDADLVAAVVALCRRLVGAPVP